MPGEVVLMGIGVPAVESAALGIHLLGVDIVNAPAAQVVRR